MTKHRITRRQALLSLPALAAGSKALAQSGNSPIRVRSLSHITVTVSDRQRSVEFYQGLFGLPIQHRQSSSTGLRIGSGLQYISMAQGGANSRPGIGHLCMTVDGFNVERVTKTLAGHGVSEGSRGPMTRWVRMRAPLTKDAPGDTPEVYFGDPDGLVVQLQDVSYCGGTGPLGSQCRPLEPPPKKGLFCGARLQPFHPARV
jgi:catechol 2,3-dioxygenase-like lactoylglutathione lyase family enzyme